MGSSTLCPDRSRYADGDLTRVEGVSFDVDFSAIEVVLV